MREPAKVGGAGTSVLFFLLMVCLAALVVVTRVTPAAERQDAFEQERRVLEADVDSTSTRIEDKKVIFDALAEDRQTVESRLRRIGLQKSGEKSIR